MKIKQMFLSDMLDMCDPDFEGHGSIYFDESDWNEIFDEVDKKEQRMYSKLYLDE